MKIILADIVLLVLGGALVATAGGPFWTEFQKIGDATTSSIGVFDLSFATGVSDLGTRQATMASSNFGPYNAPANLTKMAVIVSCSDPASAAGSFTLTVTIEGPNATRQVQNNVPCSANQRFEVPVQSVPNGTKVPGDTEAEARENVPANASSSKGMGDWTVRITGTRSGGAPGLPLQQATPSGSVKLEATAWTGKLTAENPPVEK